MLWGDTNHLYALSQNNHSFYVVTVTKASPSQALGSPYNIRGPLNMIVQSK
jgi:hypothetical protein